MRFIIPRFLNLSRSRGQAKNNRPTAFFNRLRQHSYFFFGCRHIHTAYVITFDEINSPLSIHFKQRIIICLSCLAISHSVHIWIPATDRAWISNLVCSPVSVLYCHMCMCSDSWNTTHYVNTKLQAKAMYIICKCLKARAIC